MSGRPSRLVILAQYDDTGGLPPHVRIHLERLQPIAGRLVLVSNSPLSAEARSLAESLCDRVVVRENTGWDFAAWRDALAEEDATMWNWTILTNSSVVGPLFPLAPIVTQMENRGVDFWGMVHSRHIQPHLQSYFLGFSRSVTSSDAWRRFWAQVENIESKTEVIRRYEVRLTGILQDAGFSFESFVENPKFPESIKIIHINRLKGIRLPMNVNYVNKTVALHYDMILNGMPYLKASLLWGKDVHRRTPMERIRSIPGVDYPWAEIGF